MKFKTGLVGQSGFGDEMTIKMGTGDDTKKLFLEAVRMGSIDVNELGMYFVPLWEEAGKILVVPGDTLKSWLPK